MTISPQPAGVFLTLDDAGYLADLLDHLCRTQQPSARLAHLSNRMRKSCDSLTPTQGNRLRGVQSQPDPGDPAAYDLVDAAEAARLLGITPAGVRDLLRRGKLPGVRRGGRWMLPARVVVERAERRGARRAG